MRRDIADLRREVDSLKDELGPGDESELIIHDEVVETPWSPDDPAMSAPEPGHTYTRYYTNERGERVTEELTEEEYREAVQ